jgi:hypothetical protein
VKITGGDEVAETDYPSDAGDAGEAHVALHEGRLMRQTEQQGICITKI